MRNNGDEVNDEKEGSSFSSSARQSSGEAKVTNRLSRTSRCQTYTSNPNTPASGTNERLARHAAHKSVNVKSLRWQSQAFHETRERKVKKKRRRRNEMKKKGLYWTTGAPKMTPQKWKKTIPATRPANTCPTEVWREDGRSRERTQVSQRADL